MSYRLGKSSRKKLEGVDPALVRVMERAIEITEQDFSVISGVRTAEEQNKLFRKGASTKDGFKRLSRHQTGDAVDVAAWEGGVRWEPDLYYPIARAVRQAAEELGVRIRWGGAWRRLDRDAMDPELMVAEYVDSAIRRGRKPFPDLGHFELA